MAGWRRDAPAEAWVVVWVPTGSATHLSLFWAAGAPTG